MLAGDRERSEPGGAPAALLDLNKGIVEVGLREFRDRGCKRAREDIGFVNTTTGEWHRSRCHATNLCKYCQALYIQETVRMLVIDAEENPPTLWVTLTAREFLTRADCRRHLEAMRRVARKRWPDLEWFVQVEFQRRGALHLNLLIKGVPVTDAQELHRSLVERWCARVDAKPHVQHFDVIADAVAVSLYVSKMLAHGLKQEQAPPIGWKGHRTSQTRGYFPRGAAAMREEAKASLRISRELWKLEQEHEDVPADILIDSAVDRAENSGPWKFAYRPVQKLRENTPAGEWPGPAGAGVAGHPFS